MNVSRVSFGEVQRSLAGIKNYAQVARAGCIMMCGHGTRGAEQSGARLNEGQRKILGVVARRR